MGAKLPVRKGWSGKGWLMIYASHRRVQLWAVRGFSPCHRLQCRRVGGNAMPFPQPTWVVVGEPRLVLLVAPDQDPEGKIDAHRLRGLHQRSAGLGLPKMSTSVGRSSRPALAAA